jgi:nitroimidazol reductase NimA-like FMN-containing flavoprotein (pyridoxamine 5'-phosphate oxidase superfamily)
MNARIHTREDLLIFLKAHKHLSIATLKEDGAPSVAYVAYSHTDNLEIIIGTSIHSRKAENILRDPRVALEITDEAQLLTVQIEGTAVLLDRDEFEEKYASAHYGKLPESAPFDVVEEQRKFLITPTFIRFNDCNTYPWLESIIVNS